MDPKFFCLNHTLEKLLEAEYFLGKLTISNGIEYQFNLNAFLSASRSVTFVLQKTMSGAPGFADWYQVQQELMRSDSAMGFFVDLRNVSQKEEGAVSIIGAANLDGTWTYIFVDKKHLVPLNLRGLDIAFCCSEHLRKIALVILDFYRNFPHFSCPHLALTLDGMNRAGLKWEDVERIVGVPSGYARVAGIPDQEKLRILRRELEPLDIEAITRMSIGDLRIGDQKLSFKQGRHAFLDCVSDNLSAGERNLRSAFITGVMQRIAEESQNK